MFTAIVFTPFLDYILRSIFICNLTGCGQTCSEPFTSAPIGSPCACLLPMKVKLLLGVSPYLIFSEVNELAIEVAAGTYLMQSQVMIIGATADIRDQGRTVVDINLVPLGDKFDNTTAMLTYQRFLHKKIPLNRTLFGDYEVLYVIYPGKILSCYVYALPLQFFILETKKLVQVSLLHHHLAFYPVMVQVEVPEISNTLLLQI